MGDTHHHQKNELQEENFIYGRHEIIREISDSFFEENKKNERKMKEKKYIIMINIIVIEIDNKYIKK